jgi:uroporphyrinogen III methyltransferase/synthase
MSDRPRVVVTRRAEQAGVLADKLRAAGLEPVLFPTIRLKPLPSAVLDGALRELALFDWLIFTSANGVDFFFRRARELGLTLKIPRTAVVGPATARRLTDQGVAVDFIPAKYTGAALAAGLGDLSGQRVLLPRAGLGGREITERLGRRGADVLDVPLYDTVTAEPGPMALARLRQGYEAVTFTSPSGVRGFIQLAGWPDEGTIIACIGPSTAQAAQAAGLPVTVTPEEYTLDGLVESVAAHLTREKGDKTRG